LLLVRSHQAEIIIVKRLIQGHNNVSIRVGVESKSRDRDHMVLLFTVSSFHYMFFISIPSLIFGENLSIC